MLTSSQKLCAIAWAAGNRNLSYGQFSVMIDEQEKESIYSQYAKLLEDRRLEEQNRLASFADSTRKKPRQREIVQKGISK